MSIRNVLKNMSPYQQEALSLTLITCVISISSLGTGLFLLNTEPPSIITAISAFFIIPATFSYLAISKIFKLQAKHNAYMRERAANTIVQNETPTKES